MSQSADYSDTIMPLVLPNAPISSSSLETRATSINKRLHENAALRASKNITLMVVWTMHIYIFGNIPYTLAYVFGLLFTQYSEKLHMFTTVSKGLLFLAHGVNFFIYFSFNTMYRDVFFGYLISARNFFFRK